MKNNILQRLTAFTLTLGLSLTALHPVYANTTKIEKNLQANYPDVKVESITQSPLKGIYEVYMGGRMIYTNEDAQYVLVGDLLDLKNKKNLKLNTGFKTFNIVIFNRGFLKNKLTIETEITVVGKIDKINYFLGLEKEEV